MIRACVFAACPPHQVPGTPCRPIRRRRPATEPTRRKEPAGSDSDGWIAPDAREPLAHARRTVWVIYVTTDDRRVLYIVSCAAPPTLEIETLIELAQADEWDTCLIFSSRAARWREAELAELAELTGHPVRFDYKMPWEEDVLPPADAMLVCPATSNTLNKWALGISDELHLGLITEAIGKGLPLVALPYLNARQAMHPAFDTSIAVLRSVGVKVLLGDGGFVPHEPGQGERDEYPWRAALAAFHER